MTKARHAGAVAAGDRCGPAPGSATTPPGRWPGALLPAATAIFFAVAPASPFAGPARAENRGDAVPPARFVNVAPHAGLDTIIYCGGPNRDHILESVGSGIAFLDYDRDGRLDIYVVNAWLLDESPSAVRTRGRNVLYHNLGGGRFRDVTARAGVGDDGWGCGVCVGDYDGDGWEDIYVTNFGPNRLYRNLGDGRFEQVAETAGVADPGWGGGAAFFDADGDGDLDLYVANYIECTIDDVLTARRTTRWQNKAHVMTGPFGLRGGRDRFYRNNGDGTFTEATTAAGMEDLAEGYGLGVLASDLDNDGDVDVYVANDSNPNYLYRNNGDGTFEEIGAWCGAGFSASGAAQAGMGVEAGDLDGDGLQEIFVTNFARDHCTLYHNSGDLFFEDVTTRWGLARVTFLPLSWGCAFVDFDLDADLDLFIVNGHIYPQVDEFPELGESYAQRPLLLRNDGRRFVDISDQAGEALAEKVRGRGLAVGDYDADGDPDLLISAIDSPPLLLRNDTPRRGHWLTLRLLTPGGSHVLNARAIVQTGQRRQVREVRSGSTYASQSSLDLYFGLAAATRADRVEVIWPGGQRTVIENVPADQVLTLRMPAP